MHHGLRSTEPISGNQQKVGKPCSRRLSSWQSCEHQFPHPGLCQANSPTSAPYHSNPHPNITPITPLPEVLVHSKAGLLRVYHPSLTRLLYLLAGPSIQANRGKISSLSVSPPSKLPYSPSLALPSLRSPSGSDGDCTNGSGTVGQRLDCSFRSRCLRWCLYWRWALINLRCA